MNPVFLTPRRATRAAPTRWAMAASLTAILATGVLPGTTLHAQGPGPPRGAGPDARTPPAGSLRIGVGATWARNAEAYDANGIVRELGARFSLDPIGASAFPLLGPVETQTQSLAATPDFTASLGRSVAKNRKTFETTPITLEYGVTRRLALGVTVPFVTSISRVDFAMNPLGANVGFNPSLTSPEAADANALLLGQFDGAAAFLNERIATCTANPQATGCGPITANIESARALVAQSAAFATTMGTLYGGRAGTAGAPFVPLEGSAAQAAIGARVEGFRAQYASFGATQLQAPGPTGAGAPLTASDFQRLLGDSTFGIIANPIGSVVRRGIGDIDLSAMWQWHDSWSDTPPTGSLMQRLWWRSAVVGTIRLGTGSAADPAELIAVPLGDGQNDIEVRSITDVGVGTRFSVTGAFRYTLQNTSEETIRIGTVGSPFWTAGSALTISRNPGDEFAADFYPRVFVSEAVSFAAHYGYRHKGEDAFPSLGLTDSAGPNQASPSAGTSASAHILGASLAYSTVAAYTRGAARWPIEISIDHFQTTRGSGGATPKLAYDAVTLRYYWRLRRAAPARGRD